MRKVLLYIPAVFFVLFFLGSCKKAADPQFTSVTDYDGHIYKVVTVCDKNWMIGNLRATHYADGTPLVDASRNATDSSSRAFYYYNNDTAYLYDYGYFYSWAAVMNRMPSSNGSPSGVQGPCPNGYHVPSDAEYQSLLTCLGGPSVAGGLMKGFSYWQGHNAGYSTQDACGFNVFPSGWITATRICQWRTAEAFIWTTTENAANSSKANAMNVNVNSAAVIDSAINKSYGLSCRCVQN